MSSPLPPAIEFIGFAVDLVDVQGLHGADYVGAFTDGGTAGHGEVPARAVTTFGTIDVNFKPKVWLKTIFSS